MTRSFRSRRHRQRIAYSLCALILALAAFGCGGESPVAEQNPGTQYVTLPGGTRLAVPGDAVFFYSHIPVTSALTAGALVHPNHDELVVARIDWSLCNPRAGAVEFTQFGGVIQQSTWRIPTLVTTPLAGISVLGIFGGAGTLEGGLRVDLHNGGITDNGANGWRVKDGCAGDWVSLYGYTR